MLKGCGTLIERYSAVPPRLVVLDTPLVYPVCATSDANNEYWKFPSINGRFGPGLYSGVAPEAAWPCAIEPIPKIIPSAIALLLRYFMAPLSCRPDAAAPVVYCHLSTP